MTVFRDLSGVPPEARNSAVTIGNFDGTHAGHQRIFRRVAEVSRERGWRPSVLTFDPHPTRVVAPAKAPKLLTTLDERFEPMRAAGIEQVFVIPFDRAFSELTPEQFVERVLVDGAGARAVFVGENFRFGNRQAGDVDLLRRLGKQYGFEVEIIGGVTLRGRMVSSTEVRNLLQAGSVSLACRLLGRPYSLQGEVVRGHGIGSKQTVPTLNLDWRSEILPATGVYITQTEDPDDGRSWHSITNVGYRPTFDDTRLSVETFLLDPLTGETPRRIRVEFLRRVREERKFESPDALKRQILSDVARAQSYFKRREKWTSILRA
jgi:riboflavin kinase/FMN adenylyltransferase